jgi:hypothetical protein
LHFEDGERQLMAARLGLDENADDTAVSQAMATWLQEEPVPDSTSTETIAATDDTSDLPDDGSVVVVDVAEFRRLRQRDVQAAEVEETTRRRDRDELIEEAIHDGKFSPSRREHYRARYDSDQEGTVALIGRLTENTVPLEARGVDVPTDEVDDTLYPKDWAPEVAARAARPASRVHGED